MDVALHGGVFPPGGPGAGQGPGVLAPLRQEIMRTGLYLIKKRRFFRSAQTSEMPLSVTLMKKSQRWGGGGTWILFVINRIYKSTYTYIQSDMISNFTLVPYLLAMGNTYSIILITYPNIFLIIQ